jgi:hypothetical protein
VLGLVELGERISWRGWRIWREKEDGTEVEDDPELAHNGRIQDDIALSSNSLST